MKYIFFDLGAKFNGVRHLYGTLIVFYEKRKEKYNE